MFNEELCQIMAAKYSKDAMILFARMLSDMYNEIYKHTTKDVINEASYERDWWKSKHEELIKTQ